MQIHPRRARCAAVYLPENILFESGCLKEAIWFQQLAQTRGGNKKKPEDERFGSGNQQTSLIGADTLCTNLLQGLKNKCTSDTTKAGCAHAQYNTHNIKK